MDLINNSKYKIILGSSSSRRKELLELTGINFTIQTYTINEDFPDNLKPEIGLKVLRYHRKLYKVLFSFFYKVIENQTMIETSRYSKGHAPNFFLLLNVLPTYS